jgi:hypothetical protein
VLFLFKCGLSSKVGLRHLSWNNSGGSAIAASEQLVTNIFNNYVPTNEAPNCKQGIVFAPSLPSNFEALLEAHDKEINNVLCLT